MSDQELIESHDEVARNTVVGIDYYLRELQRRDLARSARAANRVAACSIALAVVSLFVAVAAIVTG